ncbi:MAG: pyrroline-5-carboxylate reductase family protein, partial [Brachybacterium tyrofermentans]
MNDSTPQPTSTAPEQDPTQDPAQGTSPDSARSSARDVVGVRVAVIGAGNMGGPVARSFLAAGVRGEDLRIANSTTTSSERAAQELGASAASRAEALEGADVVVLGVKP